MKPVRRLGYSGFSGFSRPRRREWIETGVVADKVVPYQVSPVLDGGSGLKQKVAQR